MNPRQAGNELESGPAVVAGASFALFGGGPLTWTARRLYRRGPAADGVSRVASAAPASLGAVAALVVGA